MTANQNIFESLARQVGESVSQMMTNLRQSDSSGFSGMTSEEISRKIRPLIETVFDEFKLVSIAEFEVQTQLLSQLNEQVKILEARLQILELSDPSAPKLAK
ncbi:MAG: accessory factor UbiK family protein [Pseudomonadales bacterium]|nr:accessory factor UbiK family protein [Pseudomonadales bacterium]